MTREDVIAALGDDENVVLLDGPEFDVAILGIVERYGQPRVVCYDYEKVIEVLKSLGLDDEAAVEWWDYNIIGAWMGEETPCFLHRIEQ